MIKNPVCVAARSLFSTQGNTFNVTDSHLSIYQHYDPDNSSLRAFHHSVCMNDESQSYVYYVYFDALGVIC